MYGSRKLGYDKDIAKPSYVILTSVYLDTWVTLQAMDSQKNRLQISAAIVWIYGNIQFVVINSKYYMGTIKMTYQLKSPM